MARAPATADLADAYGEALSYCELPFRDAGGRTAFFGPVRTLRCRGDNALLQRLASEPGEGAVLVVDGQGRLDSALLGDVAAARAAANGWSGFVIAGAVRDLAALKALDIGVKHLASTPRRSGKQGEGEIDGPIALGGQVVRSGQWIYADEDGVVLADRALHAGG